MWEGAHHACPRRPEENAGILLRHSFYSLDEHSLTEPGLRARLQVSKASTALKASLGLQALGDFTGISTSALMLSRQVLIPTEPSLQPSLCFSRQGLSLAWNSSNRVGWLASEPQESACIHHPSPEITSSKHQTQRFPRVWRIELGSPHLHNKHCTN